MFFVYNPIGKTLAEVAEDTKHDVRNGYFVYLLSDEEDTIGSEVCEVKTLLDVIAGYPQLKHCVVKYVNTFFDKVIIRVIERDYSDAKAKEETLKMIYEQLKRLYKDSYSVSLYVTADGMEVSVADSTFFYNKSKVGDDSCG